MELKAIGTIHSELQKPGECPLQENEHAPEAVIEIFDEFTVGLKDIKPGDHIVLLTWLHRADRTVLATRPRNDPKVAITGVFSTRSPDRPNPIGIHYVHVTSIEQGDKITVSGLEAIDQTPVIDLKPDLKKEHYGIK
ncbi:tRNA (N6-threonylcarbamoyladenosine(37)-N6)-methyltransferase TrmO [Sinomicrobium weinanense]|uniref:tRNA (N6-threonylcarbamoyladenosine(37)-N6)-methyltransferase TrmO n=1 Tax=Sinomicrobium weinanense TaxID=2842200 RepID=A0A926Q3Y7_9FLAO|nr:tRNA (N6-threonylcarbamoyladenosine(37)-N6)-methyltransferase TrmO [Sinomicrobium weinanense]MBC9798067.1 tRNA (N6-threonylcarbamoyladenosine(37)-N6)-methyltransferase TrmO [Sinomicrobium weinanense]MBU3122520.1 tRNA (N6-threonylcarbamoyladenosine(37)-N6)-methyltransferase TrmO [Sinomicrobium weinanense]